MEQANSRPTDNDYSKQPSNFLADFFFTSKIPSRLRCLLLRMKFLFKTIYFQSLLQSPLSVDSSASCSFVRKQITSLFRVQSQCYKSSIKSLKVHKLRTLQMLTNSTSRVPSEKVNQGTHHHLLCLATSSSIRSVFKVVSSFRF